MTRALLEQALEALDKSPIKTRAMDVCVDAIRAELAKPEQPAPTWHDAPTVPGLWVCNVPPYLYYLGQGEVDDINRRSVNLLRWFGPMPEDTP